MKAIFRVITYLLLMVGLHNPVHAQLQDYEAPKAQKGELDLRYNNLSAKPISLNGEWTFYWKQLMFPGDTVPGKLHYIQYPKRLVPKDMPAIASPFCCPKKEQPLPWKFRMYTALTGYL
jgi:hypothetical protein